MNETYRIDNDEIIIGQYLPVFIHNFHYILTNIKIYKDGKIDCWELVDYDGFVEKVNSGWVKTSIPEETDLYGFPLGNFKVKSFYPNRNEVELLKEVKDIIEDLNGRPTSSVLCSTAFKKYQQEPNAANKEVLKTFYENVPAHCQKFILGDMDVDDIPIRVVLYGEDEFEKSEKGKIQKEYIKSDYLKGLL